VNQMTTAVTLVLAHLRQHGYLSAAGLPLGELESRADPTGRRIHVVNCGGDDALLVYGWQGAEPPASTHGPRLARRTLSPTATRTLVVVHALMTDPRTDRTVVTNERVLTAFELLTGRRGQERLLPVLEHTLPDAGLTLATAGGWCAGPRMRVWDAATRDVMTHAARKLWQHPSWPEISR
jgi:hypothetical protein